MIAVSLLNSLMSATLEELKSRVKKFNEERDWGQFHTPKNLAMAISAEAAELMEHFLWCGSEASLAVAQEEKKRVPIEQELADILILSLQFANAAGIDLEKAIEAKMKLNGEKYPVEKAKGSSLKYNEL